MKSERRITGSDKKLLLVIGLPVALIVVFVVWRQWVNALPDVEIPTPNLPSPNAYDFYVKAAAVMVAANPPVDAVHDTERVPESQWKARYPLENKEAWLRKNAKSLQLIRQGFKYQCLVPPERLQPRRMPEKRFPEMARLLIVESRVHAERGNWRKAADSALDVLELGNDSAQGGHVMDFLFSAAVHGIGRNELWKVLPQLNATESKAAIVRLEKIVSARVSYSDVMREEKYYTQAQLLKQLRANKWGAIGLTTSPGWQMPIQLLLNAVMPRRTVMRNHEKLMDAFIVDAKQPYAKRAKTPPRPNDAISQILAPVYDRARWNYARFEAGNSLVLVALALRAYKLEHNRYPKTLNELVPRYLTKIPADPYGGGEALRYKLRGAEYLLYSMGPDGIDDGGRAIEDAKVPREKRSRFLVRPESKGDMVAGVN